LVKELDPLVDTRWDGYVRAHPAATVYHLGAWAQVLRAAYGFEPRYLTLESATGELTGVLPLMRKNGLISDARLRSIPVFAYGGPLGDSPADETALLEAALAMAERDGKVRALSVNLGVRPLDAPAFERREIEPTWFIELPPDLDAARAGWRKTSNNVFRSLRKAERSELRVREATSDRDLRTVHTLYVRTMRKHRSLPRTLRHLRVARDTLADGMKMWIVDHRGRDVAAGVYHVFGEELELVYNGSDERALSLRPNHLLYWHVMCWAAERGLRRINLGGAEIDTPLAHFKAQWGAAPQRRFRLDHRVGGKATRTESMTALGYGAEESENRLVAAAWEHVPLPALRLAAHLAYRYA
jgi:hypothetical protein